MNGNNNNNNNNNKEEEEQQQQQDSAKIAGIFSFLVYPCRLAREISMVEGCIEQNGTEYFLCPKLPFLVLPKSYL